MAQGTDWAVAVTQAFFVRGSIPAARRSCLASLVDAHLSFDVESVAKYGCNQSFTVGQRGYGATVARLTPDQKVGSSNLSALTCESVRVLCHAMLICFANMLC